MSSYKRHRAPTSNCSRPTDVSCPESKNTSRPQPVRRFRGVTFAVVAQSVAARDRFRSSLLASGARSPVILDGVAPFLCYSPGATVSELSVTPSHAIPDFRHSAATLRVVPTVCRITTRLLPRAGSVLPTRLYRSAFHEPGQLRHHLLTMVGPSRCRRGAGIWTVLLRHRCARCSPSTAFGDT